MNSKSIVWGMVFLFHFLNAPSQNFPQIVLKQSNPLYESSGNNTWTTDDSLQYNLCSSVGLNYEDIAESVFVILSPTDTLSNNDWSYKIIDNPVDTILCDPINALKINWLSTASNNSIIQVAITNGGSGGLPEGFFITRNSSNGPTGENPSNVQNIYYDSLRLLLGIPNDGSPIDTSKIYEIPCGTHFSDSLINSVVGYNEDAGCNATTAVSKGRRPIRRFRQNGLATSRNSHANPTVDTFVWGFANNCRKSDSVFIKIKIRELCAPLDPPQIFIADYFFGNELQAILGLENGESLNKVNGDTFFIARCQAAQLTRNVSRVFAIDSDRDTIPSDAIKVTLVGLDSGSIAGSPPLSPICSNNLVKWEVTDKNGKTSEVIIRFKPSFLPTFERFLWEGSDFMAFRDLLVPQGVPEMELFNLFVGSSDTFRISCDIAIPLTLLDSLVLFRNTNCNGTTAVSKGRRPIRRLTSNKATTSRNNENDKVCFAYELIFDSPNSCEAIKPTFNLFIEIIDSVAPQFTYIPPDITINETALNQLPQPTVAECNNYRLDIDEEIEELPNTKQRILTKTWTATDECGNSATVSQKVTILLESVGNCHPNCELQLPCPEDMYVVIPRGSSSTPITWTPPLPVQMNCAMETTECALSPVAGFQYIGAFQGSKYYLSNNRDNVENATTTVRANGGQLLTIDNGDENNFIQENISEIVHIGINDLNQEGVFQKNDGTMPTYFNWGSFFLNNRDNNYAIFQPWDGSWSLVNKWVYKHFVLEIPCNTEIPPITLEQTSGPMNGTNVAAGTYNISYAAEVCNVRAECDFTLTVVESDNCGNDCQGVPYCESEGINPWEEWIAHVGLGNIQHTSGKDGFGDYTNQSTTLNAGQSYDMTITTNFSWQNAPNYLRVWIDFNRNDQFDTEELVRQEILALRPNFERIRNRQFSISIPDNVHTGVTRMRISLSRNQPSNPCENITFGEVEDYSILLENASQSRGVPMNDFRFTAFASDLKTRLQWVSNMGYKSSHFEVQRSIDGLTFTTIAEVDKSSNLETLTSYHFEDVTPAFGSNYYRIKQLHKDNSYLFTAPQKVKFGGPSNGLTVFPNPANKALFLSVQKSNQQSATIQLYNLLGQAQSIEQATALNDDLIHLDVANVPSGIYYLTVKIEGQALKTKKIYIDQQK